MVQANWQLAKFMIYIGHVPGGKYETLTKGTVSNWMEKRTREDQLANRGAWQPDVLAKVKELSTMRRKAKVQEKAERGRPKFLVHYFKCCGATSFMY